MPNSNFGCVLFFSWSVPILLYLFSFKVFKDIFYYSKIFVFFAHSRISPLPNKPPHLKVILTNKPAGAYSIIYGTAIYARQVENSMVKWMNTVGIVSCFIRYSESNQIKLILFTRFFNPLRYFTDYLNDIFCHVTR